MTMKTRKKPRYNKKKIIKRNKTKARRYKLKSKRNNSKIKKRIERNKSPYENQNTNINCSPKKKYELNKYTCYTDKSLIKLKELWNKRHPDVILKTNNPKKIHNELSYLLGSVCNNELCWLKQNFHFGNVHRDLVNDFAPESPHSWKKNKNEWLSSVDIMNVMSQYEKAYPCFEFFGPSPIDFDARKLYGECVWNEICNFNLSSQIKSGKTKFGFIFNTDPHFKDGEHWISLFVNLKKKEIIYFDSTGDKIPREIKLLVNRIISQGHQLNPSIELKYSNTEGIEHQKGNTECGIYCLYFIINILKDETNTQKLKSSIIPDHNIERYRDMYFN